MAKKKLWPKAETIPWHEIEDRPDKPDDDGVNRK